MIDAAPPPYDPCREAFGHRLAMTIFGAGLKGIKRGGAHGN